MSDNSNPRAPWDIPSTWVWTSTGEITRVVGGGTPPTGDARNYDGGELSWITPADLSGYTEKLIARGSRNITRIGLDSSGARLMPPGTVLFSSRAPIGYVAIAARELATNQGFKSFIPPEGLLPDYLFYYLQRAKQLAVDLASGTTFLEISGAKASQIPLAVAPTPEQRRIVAKIEEQLTRLDAAVVALKRVQANLKRYRASVLKAACEGRLVPTEAELARKEGRLYEPASELLKRILQERRAKWETDQFARMLAAGKTSQDDSWKERYKEPEPPDTSSSQELPEGWIWTSLGRAFEVYVGATPSRAKPGYWNGDIPWVSSGEVAFCRIRETRERITEAGLGNSSTYLQPPGTVLLGMIGEGKTRGQSAILDIAACNNQNCAAVRVSRAGLPPEYLYRHLESEYERTRTLGSGNNQPALNKARVEHMLFPLPPLREQQRIVAELESRLSVVDALQNQASEALLRSTRLRQAILKRAFEGKLVPQDPNDEPASVLLERIRVERAAQVKREPKPNMQRKPRRAAAGIQR